MNRAIIIIPSGNTALSAFHNAAQAVRREVYGGRATIVRAVVSGSAMGACSATFQTEGAGTFRSRTLQRITP